MLLNSHMPLFVQFAKHPVMSEEYIDKNLTRLSAGAGVLAPAQQAKFDPLKGIVPNNNLLGPLGR